MSNLNGKFEYIKSEDGTTHIIDKDKSSIYPTPPIGPYEFYPNKKFDEIVAMRSLSGTEPDKSLDAMITFRSKKFDSSLLKLEHTLLKDRTKGGIDHDLHSTTNDWRYWLS